MIDFYLALLAFGVLFATCAYGFALRAGSMAIVDLVWTLLLGLGGFTYVLILQITGEASLRSWIVFSVLFAWSFRLSGYLLRDRVRGNKEDPRYANLAKHWGSQANRNFYFLFLAQVFLATVFLVPVVHAANNPAPLGGSDVLAVGIALLALLGETIADKQLADFRAKPTNQGKVCVSGLWRYSRHPNYFFEWLHWWAYAAFAMTGPDAWICLIGPLLMYIFLRYVTGIPHAERSSLQHRGEAYRRYQQTTSPFFPWIPRQLPS